MNYIFNLINLDKYRKDKLRGYKSDKNRFISMRKSIKIIAQIVIVISGAAGFFNFMDCIIYGCSEKINIIYLILLIITSTLFIESEFCIMFDNMINELNERLKKDGGEEVNLS